MNNSQAILQQFMNFKNSFKGNAEQQVKTMLNNGQITQEQYNQAVQRANELIKMLNSK